MKEQKKQSPEASTLRFAPLNLSAEPPVFFERGEGACLFDSNDKAYIDYVGSWGPMILGHAHPQVIECVTETVAKGLSFGAPTQIETLMAEKVCEIMPNIEKVRMVNSGTEAGYECDTSGTWFYRQGQNNQV